jgi:hypothetical protein
VTTDEDGASAGVEAESLDEESVPSKRAEVPGSSAPSDDAAVTDVAPEILTQRLVRGQSQLDAALALTEPDCGAALRFRQLVCNLADRICSISDGVDASQVSRCSDGKRRCVQSEQAFAARCE